MEKENKLLEQGKTSIIAKSVDKKEELLMNLQNIEGNIGLYVSENTIEKDPKIIERVKNCFSRLQSLMQQNEILLQINIMVSEKIVEIYKEKRVDQTVRQFGYNQEGTISALKNLEKVMPAISLNNKV
jgi:flagellar biosynthesis/type III secretory pathway chaperone